MGGPTPVPIFSAFLVPTIRAQLEAEAPELQYDKEDKEVRAAHGNNATDNKKRISTDKGLNDTCYEISGTRSTREQCELLCVR